MTSNNQAPNIRLQRVTLWCATPDYGPGGADAEDMIRAAVTSLGGDLLLIDAASDDLELSEPGAPEAARQEAAQAPKPEPAPAATGTLRANIENCTVTVPAGAELRLVGVTEEEASFVLARPEVLPAWAREWNQREGYPEGLIAVAIDSSAGDPSEGSAPPSPAPERTHARTYADSIGLELDTGRPDPVTIARGLSCGIDRPDIDACPGCGRRREDGLSPGCDHDSGCGASLACLRDDHRERQHEGEANAHPECPLCAELACPSCGTLRSVSRAADPEGRHDDSGDDCALCA